MTSSCNKNKIMNGITFVKGQGGVPKSLPGEDHISGLILYSSDLPTSELGYDDFSTTNRIINIGTIEQAETLGIKPYNSGDKSQKFDLCALHYHLAQAFRINPAVSVYVGIFPQSADFAEIRKMQEFAEGSIRQIGIYAPGKKISTVAITGADLTAIQGVCTELESEGTPLNVLYSATVTSVDGLENLSSVGRNNVSVLIGQDGAGIAAAMYADADLNPTATKKSVGSVGIAIGTVSKASVHESIAWVQKFPTGVDVPAFADGSLVKNMSTGNVDALNSKRFLFFIKHAGITGSFFNDSHTMDLATGDYAFIEAMRTIDKAVRGVRTYLIPYIASPLYVNAETGELTADTCAYLEQLAGRQLEDMERAGELSGYVVEIDPKQNVLATSTVEFVIKQVGVGVMRKISVKIGFTTKLN